jgi:acyl-CoA reductase-like NAD-dependent aldehyde dehydrogenase
MPTIADLLRDRIDRLEELLATHPDKDTREAMKIREQIEEVNYHAHKGRGFKQQASSR